jgi:hypothetical protein
MVMAKLPHLPLPHLHLAKVEKGTWLDGHLVNLWWPLISHQMEEVPTHPQSPSQFRTVIHLPLAQQECQISHWLIHKQKLNFLLLCHHLQWGHKRHLLFGLMHVIPQLQIQPKELLPEIHQLPLLLPHQHLTRRTLSLLHMQSLLSHLLYL